MFTPEQVSNWKDQSKNRKAGRVSTPSGELLNKKYAYILVPPLATLDSIQLQRYAHSMDSVIKALDQHELKGWIIDLRSNYGGNSWGMISGLGSLIGNGTYGYALGPNKKKVRFHDKGSSGYDKSQFKMSHPPHSLINTKLPIAVLQGRGTASAGEAVAISFIGLNSKSFGDTTAGATTSVANFEMSDGSWLNLAVAKFADRNENVFPQGVPADQLVRNHKAICRKAKKWIDSQSD